MRCVTLDWAISHQMVNGFAVVASFRQRRELTFFRMMTGLSAVVASGKNRMSVNQIILTRHNAKRKASGLQAVQGIRHPTL